MNARSSSSLLSTVLLVLAACVAFGAFLITVSPPVRESAQVGSATFDPAPLAAAFTPARVESWRERIQAGGPRNLGQPGHEAVARLAASAFREMGLEVVERREAVAAPVIEQAEVLDSQGVPLSGVSLHPFFPNLFQPVATPRSGLKGELVLLDENTIRTRTDFKGVIGVVDLNAPPASFGLLWTRYAQLGIEGLILTHRGGEPPNWLPLWQDNTMVSTLPINFLRAFAGPGILDHLGENVTLHLRQRFQEVPNASVVAFLRAKHPSSEALVITGHYDAYGLLPSLANGDMQAYSPATVLALAETLAPYRGTLQRDVVFVLDGSEMMGGIGEAAVISAFGPAGAAGVAAKQLEQRQSQNVKELAIVEHLQDIMESPGFLTDPSATQDGFERLNVEERDFLETQLRHVMNTLVFEAGEEVLKKKLPLERARIPVTSGPDFDALQKTISRFNRIKAASAAGPTSLLERHAQTVSELGVREKLISRFVRLRDFHTQRASLFETDLALNRKVEGYRSLLVLSPRLLPSTPSTDKAVVALLPSDGPRGAGSRMDRQAPILNSWMEKTTQKPGLVESLTAVPITPNTYGQIYPSVGNMPVTARLWGRFAHPSYAVVNSGRLASYRELTVPATQPLTVSSETLTSSLQFLGELVLSAGHGSLAIRQSDFPIIGNFSGRVLASNVGQSVVPNYLLEGALVGVSLKDPIYRALPGYFRHPLLLSNVYGRYELLDTAAEFLVRGSPTYSPQAFFFDNSGAISWTKDHSEKGVYKSEELPASQSRQLDVHLVLFRSSPVSFLDLTDPQTMEAYAATNLISREGLSAFGDMTQFPAPDVSSLFIGPDQYFYATMRAGEPDNPLVQTIRGFLLGPADDKTEVSSSGIRGEGYLAADHPLFPEIARPMAQSMLRLNESRAELQDRRHMLDPMVAGFIHRSGELLAEAEKPGISHSDSVLAARESAAYSSLVHPILRANINGAVLSILWYLGLLVPFTFFMEKLVFGFADIRKQLGAQAMIFLAVFGLLRLMHPAFEMIRSSLMILLGFVILLIAGGVTILFAGKFRENMAALESLRGKAAGAGVNTMGIVVTAFMLGLNNMHRRKVRTGLTCATLVLITFAMIAFTSVRSGFVESTVTLGPASYQGLLIKKDDGQPISPSEQFALQSRFGNRFPVSSRVYYTGLRNPWTRESSNPTLEIRTEGEAGRSTRFLSILQFDPSEPLRSEIPLITKPFWFTNESGAVLPVLISDRIARDLGISKEMIDEGEAREVVINGSGFRVAGIFDSQALNALRDVDGHSLLPPDITGIPNVRVDPAGAPFAEPGDPRIPADDVVILPNSPLGITIPSSSRRIESVVVGLDDLGFREAREVIFQYLEQTGEGAFFGLDGVASFGKRNRENSLQGLLDMIMPLVIAALTVLNTMKGSVYERKDEIYVYNAVGIAPRYIFFMFFAEAFVYSVVGAVLGYLLSQGTGFVLTGLNLTGGLNMTFAGPNTILASLAVIAAVFVSTIFPARTAMQIAAPSEDAGWRLPDPSGEEIAFNLPFTFNPHDRVAVLAFFHRFLVDHGEGGSGRFFAGPPSLDLSQNQESPVPQISATIWLKPYDLGVSQVMNISLPFDEETKEYIASISIRRLSGTRESWVRLNRSLMVQVREQFLHWRAVSQAQKEEYFASANALLDQALQGSGSNTKEAANV